MSNSLESHQGFSGRGLSQRVLRDELTGRASLRGKYPSTRPHTAGSSGLSRERQPRVIASVGDGWQGFSLSRSDPGRQQGKKKEMGKAAVCIQGDPTVGQTLS